MNWTGASVTGKSAQKRIAHCLLEKGCQLLSTKGSKIFSCSFQGIPNKFSQTENAFLAFFQRDHQPFSLLPSSLVHLGEDWSYTAPGPTSHASCQNKWLLGNPISQHLLALTAVLPFFLQELQFFFLISQDTILCSLSHLQHLSHISIFINQSINQMHIGLASKSSLPNLKWDFYLFILFPPHMNWSENERRVLIDLLGLSCAMPTLSPPPKFLFFMDNLDMPNIIK